MNFLIMQEIFYLVDNETNVNKLFLSYAMLILYKLGQ